MRWYRGKTGLVTVFLVLAFALCCFFEPAPAAGTEEGAADKAGGGYALSGQIENAGYTCVIYDSENGLPTSDANFILGARSGYIWIGSYSGIIRYDGTAFERLDTTDGLTSGRGLFEDSRGRIWVATNDNGVVVIDGEDRTHFTYKDGLPSSSIRIFAENQQDVYIGTTAGVCYVDPQMTLHVVDDERINEERVLKLESDSSGRIYGQTTQGNIFAIDDHKVSEFYESSELGTEKITTILADPDNEGKVYLGTAGDAVYYGKFGDHVDHMRRISVAPIENTHWLSYDCGRVWVSSTDLAGYLDGDRFTVLNDIPMNSGIEMMTSDFQGNLWFASSTQGIMKVVTDGFVNLTQKAALPEEVSNAACLYQDRLYIGTDNGLRIVDGNGRALEDDLTRYTEGARIRCISEDSDGNLWLSAYNHDLGLVCLTSDGAIRNYTTKDALPGNEVRCCIPARDGGVIAGTNGGLAVIRDGAVERTVGSESVKNTVFLTVAEGDDGEIYAGSDGDGIYVIKGDTVERLGRDEGLTSDVVTRIKKDEKNEVYWIVTSNSIEYLKDGEIRQVTSFPYNNNYDLYEDDRHNMWVLSSCGIYVVGSDEMLSDSITDYRLYTIANGLTGAPTSYSYSALGEDGSLFMPVRNGVCMVNINHMTKADAAVKTALSSVYCRDQRVSPDKDGVYVIPNSDARIRITASVLDYSMMNPLVKVFIEGEEDSGITAERNSLTALEYTGLKYGNYTLHVQVINDGHELADDIYQIVKKARFTELPVFQLLLVSVVAVAAGLIVWRTMKGTVIQRQYKAIKQANEDVERANTARARFLANMSHEIRTPVITIMGMNELALREDAEGVPKHYHRSMMNYASDIRSASESLLSMINNLLDMVSIESGRMRLAEQEYDVKGMLRPLISVIRKRSTEKELTFEVIVDEMLPRRLYGDAGKVRQIVFNLLANAVKYTEEGGIVLRIAMVERRDDECRLQFIVRDSGIGIKEEDKRKLFTAYDRMGEENSSVQDTGIGLDISGRFARLLGGSLTCESEYGSGSEFIFMVNQKIVDHAPVGEVREQEERRAGGSYRPAFVAPDADILVVDNNPVNLTVMKGLLRPTGVFVSTASSGEECLEKIRDTRFNVVLLDHIMPGMDGVETVKRIRETDPELPVYAVTSDPAADEAYFRSKGFDGCLIKPVDSETLEQTIMKHLPQEMVERQK